MPALQSVLFDITHQVTSGYSISLIRDPATGTSQFYLRVAWTSAFIDCVQSAFPLGIRLVLYTSASAIANHDVMLQ